MVNVNSMPCSNCKNYQGIKQPDGTEKTEYIRCKVAKDNDAKNLLYLRDGKAVCNKQDKWEDE